MLRQRQLCSLVWSTKRTSSLTIREPSCLPIWTSTIWKTKESEGKCLFPEFKHSLRVRILRTLILWYILRMSTITIIPSSIRNMGLALWLRLWKLFSISLPRQMDIIFLYIQLIKKTTLENILQPSKTRKTELTEFQKNIPAERGIWTGMDYYRLIRKKLKKRYLTENL